MFWLFLPILIYIALHDLRTKTISNSSNLIVLLIGIGYAIFYSNKEDVDWLLMLFQTALVFSLLLIVATITDGALGGGDIKLATALTLPVSLRGSEYLILAWTIVGIACIPIYLGLKLTKSDKNTAIPFAPCLAVGYLAAMV